MEIVDFIPVGHDNAITAEQISAHTGLSLRKVRDYIAAARHREVILNMQDGCGYFLPDEDEGELVRCWVAQEEARLKSIGWSLKAARKRVREG